MQPDLDGLALAIAKTMGVSARIDDYEVSNADALLQNFSKGKEHHCPPQGPFRAGHTKTGLERLYNKIGQMLSLRLYLFATTRP